MAWYLNLPVLVGQAGEAVPAVDGWLSPAMKLAIVVAIIGGSFALGSLISQALKMRDFSFKISLVLFTLFAGIAICLFGWPPKKGIDLSGGVVLVYEIDQEHQRASYREDVLKRVNQQINERRAQKVTATLNPANQNQIELKLPAGEEPAEVERQIGQMAAMGIHLELATRLNDAKEPVLVYNIRQQGATAAVDMDKMVAAVSRRINPSGLKELTIRQYGAQQIQIIIPEVESREVDFIKKEISTSGVLEFRILANRNDHSDIIALAQQTPGDNVYDGPKLVARWVKALPEVTSGGAITRETKGKVRQFLVIVDSLNVSGDYLDHAAPGFDERGSPSVNFSFNAQGAQLFGELTGRNVPDPATGFQRLLGILLDNTLQSAASIRSEIRASGQITGRFEEEHVKFLVGVLNAGHLPAALQPQPVSEQKISAELGEDTIRSGELSMVISMVAVVIFMFVYYRFAGFVADIAVTMNMILALALMILIKAALTLPGLAGLVLTVGMAVDANVLIYERMREESHRGASLRMAIRNGYSRALRTIVDSNMTTVISAIVLYVIGTDQVKGFAVSLILGLMVSMYTSIFVTRVIFDIFERKRWIKRLNMMQIVGETHYDFVGWRYPAMAASVVVIAIGLIAVYLRGPGLLDIDFTGGSSVQVLFTKAKPHDIADVRRMVAVPDLPDVTVSGVGTENRDFKIDTSERDIKKVQTTLKDIFGDALQTYSMGYKELSRIEPGSLQSPASTAAEKGATSPARDKAAAPSETPAKPSGSGKPGSGDGARRDLPRSTELALAGPAEADLTALVLAQANAKNAPAQDQTTNSAADETKESQPDQGAQPPADQGTDAAPQPEKSADEPAAPAEEQNQAAGGAPAPAQQQSPSGNEADDGTLVGGTRVNLIFAEPINQSSLRGMIDAELEKANLKTVRYVLRNEQYQEGSSTPYPDWTLEIKLPQDQTEQRLKQIQASLSKTPIFPSSNQISGKVADDTKLLAIYALLASMVIIVIYVWIRFQNIMFGVAAVVALIHDVLMTLSFLALSLYLAPYFGFLLIDPFKISLAVMAAMLTIGSYSIYDTIVVFDRIREVRGKSPDLNEKMINDSVNQTLSRTLLTSGTVFIGTLILYVVGGQGIHPFAYTMLIGVVTGTYSTVYIAAPVLLWLRKSEPTQGARKGVEAPQGTTVR